MAAVKYLTPTLWGIPRTGLTCDTCNEATVFEQDVLLSSERASEVMVVAVYCRTCDTFEWRQP